MFEHISKPLIPIHQFKSRLIRSSLIGMAMVVVSLAIGMSGYLYYFPKMDWADAFVNASMLLGGMGPLASPETTGAKIFSGLYALYCGLMVVMTAAVIFAPAVHRFLHAMHSDEGDDADADSNTNSDTNTNEPSPNKPHNLSGKH